MTKQILKVLIGSRAYGLANENSDVNMHGVYITPTSELLSLGSKPKETQWIEGREEDFQSWELGHFLHLATKCNPTILETFKAPFKCPPTTGLGHELRELFPYVLSRKRIFDAFRGYAYNQRTKLWSKPEDPTNRQLEERKWKFATQYLRVLMVGTRLLRTGELVIDMKEYSPVNSVVEFLTGVREGNMLLGKVIDTAEKWAERLELAYNNSTVQESPDLDKVNEFLLRVRKENW